MGIRSLIVALALAGALAVPATAGPLEDGMDAYLAKEYAKAAELWRPLAENGNALAQYRLGTLYVEGKGVEQSDATAFTWMRRAAIQGNAEAQYGIGASYIDGLGVKKDETEAAKWFQRAANQGMVFAQINLGLLYASGTGVPQDNVEAFKWLEIAMRTLPAGGAASDVARAMGDLTDKLNFDQKIEAEKRSRSWKAKSETN